jgi:hypothetical protein
VNGRIEISKCARESAKGIHLCSGVHHRDGSISNCCSSLLLAGGGFRAGFVYGASDKIGARPSRNPATPGDIIATLYTCLGIDPNLELTDRLGRPFALVPWGAPIRELLA